jgi:fatty acid desaturase
MTAMLVDKTAPIDRTAPGSDFAGLAREVAGAGLLDRRPGYYLARTVAVAGLFGTAWVALVMLGDSWWQVPVAALLAVASAQIALLAHDLAHRQVFRTRRPSEIAGRLAGNLAVGMSYGWWMDKHTRHHANPNHEDLDPDVAPDLLVWSAEQAGRTTAGGRVARFVRRWQGYLFVPLLTLEGLNLHVASVRALLRTGIRRRGLEAALLLAHVAGYLGAVLSVLPPGKALLFIAVHKGLFGLYLGATFAPNHKGMPTLTGTCRSDFLRRQVLTTRNVRGGRLLDAALGGLNHQIEHHLFPHMPTPNLRRARPIVRAYCARLGVPYHESGPVASYAAALRHLHRVGAPLRRSGR